MRVCDLCKSHIEVFCGHIDLGVFSDKGGTVHYYDLCLDCRKKVWPLIEEALARVKGDAQIPKGVVPIVPPPKPPQVEWVPKDKPMPWSLEGKPMPGRGVKYDVEQEGQKPPA